MQKDKPWKTEGETNPLPECRFNTFFFFLVIDRSQRLKVGVDDRKISAGYLQVDDA